jgi:hypothetical protein
MTDGFTPKVSDIAEGLNPDDDIDPRLEALRGFQPD